MGKQIIVNIADMKFTRGEGSIVTYALGSCIGITIYDVRLKLGALIHIMLPTCPQGDKSGNVYKFADAGIKETLRKLSIMGGVKSNYICKIAGGAQMFATNSTSAVANVGKHNIEAVKSALAKEGIRISAEQVGGKTARTMILDVETGQVTLRSIGSPEIKL